MFEFHPRLVAATAPLGDLPLSTVLLLDDRRFTWILLVPRRAGVEEIFELEPSDRAQLVEEIAQTSKALKERYGAFRLNVADIGNRAPQLHVHVVARFEDDAFWPETVWSREREPYDDEARETRRRELLETLRHLPGFRTPPTSA